MFVLQMDRRQCERTSWEDQRFATTVFELANLELCFISFFLRFVLVLTWLWFSINVNSISNQNCPWTTFVPKLFIKIRRQIRLRIMSVAKSKFFVVFCNKSKKNSPKSKFFLGKLTTNFVTNYFSLQISHDFCHE